MASMKIRTEYTFDALTELQRVVCKTLAPKETARRRLVPLVWCVCCLGVGGFMVANGYNAILALLLLIPGVISLVRFAFFYQMLAWEASRKLGEEQSVNDFHLEPAHILARQGKKSAVYPYANCAQLLETPKSFFFIMEDGQGLMLDKGGLKGGSVDDLRAWLEQKTGKSVQSVK